MNETNSTDKTDEKAALRLGDSWRAQVFRRKDEVFNFKYEQLTTFLAEHQNLPGWQETMCDLNKSIYEVTKNPDDETLGRAAIELINKIDSILTDAGFTRQ